MNESTQEKVVTLLTIAEAAIAFATILVKKEAEKGEATFVLSFANKLGIKATKETTNIKNLFILFILSFLLSHQTLFSHNLPC